MFRATYVSVSVCTTVKVKRSDNVTVKLVEFEIKRDAVQGVHFLGQFPITRVGHSLDKLYVDILERGFGSGTRHKLYLLHKKLTPEHVI